MGITVAASGDRPTLLHLGAVWVCAAAELAVSDRMLATSLPTWTVLVMDPVAAVLVAFAAVAAGAVLVVASAAHRSASVAEAALRELTDGRAAARRSHVLAPLRRVLLELEVPSSGGLPRWAFANVDPTFEQVQTFREDTTPLVDLARRRLLGVAAASDDPDVRAAATTAAVRLNNAWVATLARLDAGVAEHAGAGVADAERASVTWMRLADAVDRLDDLL